MADLMLLECFKILQLFLVVVFRPQRFIIELIYGGEVFREYSLCHHLLGRFDRRNLVRLIAVFSDWIKLSLAFFFIGGHLIFIEADVCLVNDTCLLLLFLCLLRDCIIILTRL